MPQSAVKAGGSDAVRDSKGRWLIPPKSENLWKPGQSGNPGGRTAAFAEAMRMARTVTPAGVKRMIELAELDNIDERGELARLSRHANPRVVAYCVDWLWSVAWGKPGNMASAEIDDKPGITIEQRRDEAMATLMAAFDRVLAAQNKASEPAVQPVEPEESTVTLENEG